MDPDAEIAAVLARLEALCFDRPWSLEQITGWLGGPGARWFLEPDGSPAAESPADSYNNRAYLLVQDHPAEFMSEILRIGVPPESRGRGRGRRLIENFVQNLAARPEKKEPGHWKIMLEVSETNTAGRALYAAAGFREIHRRRGYYADRADALILEKIVT